MKKTPWFHADEQSPRRPGLYEAKCSCGYLGRRKRFMLWRDGKWWWTHTKTVSTFGQACDQWRGLLNRPNVNRKES